MTWNVTRTHPHQSLAFGATSYSKNTPPLSSLAGDPWPQGELSCWEGVHVIMGPVVSSNGGRLAIKG